MRDEYRPVREMRANVMLGMNFGKRSERFGTVADAFSRDSAYWGERQDWYVVAACHRDSASIDRSNFAVLLEQLGGDGDGVAVEEASHWAVGWVKYLLVKPSNWQGLRRAIYAHSAVYDYPILDESHFSDLEYNEAWEWAERELGEYPNWQDAFSRATENTGYGDDEAGRAIEEARKELEELQPLWESHASCPIDPAQLKLWAGVSDRL